MCEWITDNSKPSHSDFVLVALDEEVWVAHWDRKADLWIFDDAPSAQPDEVWAWMQMPEVPRG